MKDISQKCRLGCLLVQKGLIRQSQLALALNLQVSTGLKLGEILIEQNLVTEKQIHRVLKQQTRMRLWASVLTLLLGPLSFGAMASQSHTENKESLYSSQIQSHQKHSPRTTPQASITLFDQVDQDK